MAGMNLGLGLSLTSRGRSKEPLCDAIERKLCVSAVYKKKDMRFAPHVVYGTGDNLLVDGVVVEYDGKTPNKPKLETFTVSDLKGVVVSEPGFTPHPGFDPGDVKYSGKIICIVEVV